MPKYPGYTGAPTTPGRGPNFRCPMCRACELYADTTMINCAPHPKGPVESYKCPDFKGINNAPMLTQATPIVENLFDMSVIDPEVTAVVVLNPRSVYVREVGGSWQQVF